MVAQSVQFKGSIFDQTGAPTVFEKMLVQIRDPKTYKVLTAAVLDQKDGLIWVRFRKVNSDSLLSGNKVTK
jgi:hypothetical protein